MNIKSGWNSKKYQLPREHEDEELYELVENHISQMANYDVLRDYYLGNHDILERTFEDEKPNNQVVNNFCRTLADNNASYVFGQAIAYVGRNDMDITDILQVLGSNYSREVDSENGKNIYTYGHTFEIHYINYEGEHKFKQRSPRNVFAVYSADIVEEMLYGVDVQVYLNPITGDEVYRVDVYDEYNVRHYVVEDDDFILEGTTPHPFGQVPVCEAICNEDRQGVFEGGIMSQQDAYNLIASDSVNDVDYFSNSYLVLQGLSQSEPEDLAEMKRQRILLLDGEQSGASFLHRQVEDSHVENIKERLVKDLFVNANTANITGTDFSSNLSGVAIKYKTQTMEFVASLVESKYRRLLRKRVALILTVLQARSGNDLNEVLNDIDFIFTRNLASSIPEIADSALKIRGIVSDHTLRTLFPFVHDPEMERELVREEQEENLRMQMYQDTTLSGASDYAQDSTQSREERESDFDEGQNTHNLQRASGE